VMEEGTHFLVVEGQEYPISIVIWYGESILQNWKTSIWKYSDGSTMSMNPENVVGGVGNFV